jgi:ATP-binding cassette subfamily F protein uup
VSRSVLLSTEGISKAFGARVLFESLSFGLFEGDHAGLVGPNGSGKSTLLRILAGFEPPDRGTRAVRGGVRIGYVAQDPVFPSGGTVGDAVAAVLTDIDEGDRPGRVALALGRAGFADGRADVDALSGGWQKRLAIARALAAAPDILLMDEPTNHLDVDGILWLEGVLAQEARAYLVVSHDRYLLEHVTTRVLELDRAYPDGLYSSDGPYSEFLARRDEFLRGQAAYEESLANTVRREIEWLRRGAKARATKAKGRIQQAGRLIDELKDARERSLTRTAGIEFASSERRTKKLLVTRGLGKSLGGRRLLSSLGLILTPGTRLGVIGPNGSGKTTLVDCVTGRLRPDAGSIAVLGHDVTRLPAHRIARLGVARTFQTTAVFDDLSIRENLVVAEAEGNAHHAARRAAGIEALLERRRTGALSYGERKRVELARALAMEPALLVLDEPAAGRSEPETRELAGALRRLIQDGATILLVEHHMQLVAAIADEVTVLDEGRVIARGTPAEIRNDPRVVDAYLGATG